jgi:hypothetical protein
MALGIKYRGKSVTADEIDFIKELIAENPHDSRWALSKKLCKAWGWVQPNGALRDMVCRGLMLQLHRAGHIKLPAKKKRPPNPFLRRNKPAQIHIDQSPICTKLGNMVPLDFCQVRRTESEKLFNSLIEQYHYLGYCQPVGEHLKYVVYAKQRPVACVAISSAPRHIGCRDRYIGWSTKVRRQNLHLIAYQSRFLILPWVQVLHLASHLLGRMSRMLCKDWERLYHHPVYFVETFVDLERFKGTCYKAANWVYLGKTTGRGKDDQTHKPNRSIKAVWGYPLLKNFRERLCGGTR